MSTEYMKFPISQNRFLLLLACLMGLSGLQLSCDDKPTATTTEPKPFAVDIGESQLPYVVINTEGRTILNEPKIPTQMQIFRNGERVHNQGITIEYRGSTSYRLSDKKSFGFETVDGNGNDMDVSLLGLPEEEDWILMGHVFRASTGAVFDPTLMHHYIAYEWSRAIGRYASRCIWVEVEVNGDYKGVYILMEKLKRDDQRINITRIEPTDNTAPAIEGGYILKIDKTSGIEFSNQPLSYYDNNWEDDARYQEPYAFRSQWDIFGNPLDFPAYQFPYHPQQYLETYFLYEEPEFDEITNPQKTYIQDYVSQFEQSLLQSRSTGGNEYEAFMEVNSFVDYFLLNELAGNIDAYRISTFLQKDRGGKLAMGPIWDMNIGYNRQDRVPIDDWVVNYNDYVGQDPWMVPFWWDVLLDNDAFKSALKARWVDIRSSILTNDYLENSIAEQANYLLANRAIARNYQRWSGLQVNYEQSVDELKNWVINRVNWMDDTIGSFPTIN